MAKRKEAEKPEQQPPRRLRVGENPIYCRCGGRMYVRSTLKDSAYAYCEVCGQGRLVPRPKTETAL